MSSNPLALDLITNLKVHLGACFMQHLDTIQIRISPKYLLHEQRAHEKETVEDDGTHGMGHGGASAGDEEDLT